MAKHFAISVDPDQTRILRFSDFTLFAQSCLSQMLKVSSIISLRAESKGPFHTAVADMWFRTCSSRSLSVVVDTWIPLTVAGPSVVIFVYFCSSFILTPSSIFFNLIVCGYTYFTVILHQRVEIKYIFLFCFFLFYFIMHLNEWHEWRGLHPVKFIHSQMFFSADHFHAALLEYCKCAVLSCHYMFNVYSFDALERLTFVFVSFPGELHLKFRYPHLPCYFAWPAKYDVNT